MQKNSFDPLKKDVRFLTTLLGDVIREQEGEAFFRIVEEIRTLAKNVRKTRSTEDLRALKRRIGSLSIEQSYKLARAFTIYFQLVNIAEERQRVRRIVEYEKHPETPQDMSLYKVMRDLKLKKFSAKKVESFLETMKLEPVLTAHPTEVKRRTVLEHLFRIASDLAQLDGPEVTFFGRSKLKNDIGNTLEILWQTQETRRRRVSVEDEIDQTLYFFRRTILDIAPEFERKIAAAFEYVYGKPFVKTGSRIKFGSWVGSDRDGNPFVTPQITFETAKRQRKLILKEYMNDVESLMLRSSQSEELVRASQGLLRSLENDKRNFPKLAEKLRQYESNELYRKKYSFIHHRLERTRDERRGAYAGPKELLEDLYVIQKSLSSNGGSHTAQGDVYNLITKVSVFGFCLASLDFRDHVKNVREGTPVVEQLRVMKKIQDRFGREASGDYIISMTEGADDVLTLLSLATDAGIVRRSNKEFTRASVGIVPLFENIDALRRGAAILDELLTHKKYRKYVKARGNSQEIMLGYSDSVKDGGYLQANWMLYKVQKELARVAKKHGVSLQLFHGKGGTIDRGGGQSHKAILAQPNAAVGGMIKITEQGEVVSQKYANPVIAGRNLEQLASSVILTNLVPADQDLQPKKRSSWEKLIDQLAKVSCDHYRGLVFTDEFSKFFHESTPFGLLGFSRIASRPAVRGTDDGFSSVRAIPWVFSWIQSRYIISAWYGIGTALENYVRANGQRGLKELKAMYAGWPFFRTVVENAQVSLAKTDLSIASQYADLCNDRAIAQKIHGKISSEYDMTVRRLLDITGQKALLGHQPVLRESILLRNPYVDPLNYVQLRFLQENRKAQRRSTSDREHIEAVLLLTMNGISFGMKSTG